MNFIQNLLGGGGMQGNRQSGMYVNVHVVQGRNLGRKDLFSKSDPYATVSIHHRTTFSLFGNTHRTSTFRNNQDPYWNQQFSLPVSNPETDVVKIKVYDNDPLSFDDLIGEVDVPLLGLINGIPKDEWLQLQPIRGGAVHVVITAYGFNTSGPGGYPMGMPMGQPVPGMGGPMGAPMGMPYGAPGYPSMGGPYAQPPYY